MWEGDVEYVGWLADVADCVRMISSDQFSLEEVYEYIDILREKHPDNRNIEAKIRQQLQVLRDYGVIVFLGNGNYKKVK